ncbi:unnamed protein product [Spirodela intermedia]|uniref:Uncharacterized protein n=1 Tax=Spirodela intermedia TaxID=51605 RepID=A0A7I8IY60_SPIIN|nr:unnamed protein product [Spirodela intermedia]CAA6662946.1 unnamed protein product [Spirodela intermedia]
MASPATASEAGALSPSPELSSRPSHGFFMWREFAWGAVAGGFGEGMMHPIDTMKTRMQSQTLITGSQSQKSVFRMIWSIWRNYSWVTGSLATGATYFGVIESTKKWLEEVHPSLGGHWAHFVAGALGDTLGSFVYVPCEVLKQRMQVQGTRKSWNSVMLRENVSQKQMYCYYSGMFQAGRSIFQAHGLKGLYAGYWSTLARDVPFAGLMVTFYEALKDLTNSGNHAWLPHEFETSSSSEGLFLGGLAGGLAAYITTPLDVIKTRLQVQGPTKRYNGWYDAMRRTWAAEGIRGLFRGSVPRITWYVPASALTFMAVEFLRDHFNGGFTADVPEVASITLEPSPSPSSAVQEVA